MARELTREEFRGLMADVGPVIEKMIHETVAAMPIEAKPTAEELEEIVKWREGK